jgi:hypothetical protein
VVRIHGDGHLPVVAVVLDGVFDEVRKDHRHLQFVDFRNDLALRYERQFDIALLCERTDPAADDLCEFPDIDGGDDQFCLFVIQLDEAQQLADDLVFPVDLRIDVGQEFTVHVGRHVFFGKQRVSQNLHRCHRRFQFMGNVGDEFIAALVKRIHAGQHPVEGINDVLGFEIRVFLRDLCGEARLDLADFMESRSNGRTSICEKTSASERTMRSIMISSSSAWRVRTSFVAMIESVETEVSSTPRTVSSCDPLAA